jgi:hypothetical protein
MSTPPEPSQPPAHLRPLTVEIPRTWTPEEALAVFELIDELRDKICALYNLQLQDLLRQQCAPRREVGDDTTLDHRPA